MIKFSPAPTTPAPTTPAPTAQPSTRRTTQRTLAADHSSRRGGPGRRGSSSAPACALARWRHAALALLCLASVQTLPCAQAADDSRLERQREAFRATYPDATRGNWRPVQAQAQLLGDYLLWPDLRAAYLKAKLASVDPSEIEAFLAAHGDLKPARELRYRFALQLARSAKTAAYRQLYQQHYADAGDATLDCLALRGDIADGRTEGILARTEPLWLVPKSQVKSCDPVFAYLRKTGQLSGELYRQRYQLTINARNFSLARYLARSLGAKTQREAANWQRAHSQPEALLKALPASNASAVERQQLVYALQRLNYRDPELAHDYWSDLRARHRFTEAQRRTVEQHTALWAVRKRSPIAPRLVSELPAAAVSEDIRTWQLRALLRDYDWPAVSQTIESLPATERDSEVWTYWLGYAQGQQGHAKKAATTLQQLARTRGYYGFLAADALQSDYHYQHQRIQRDDARIAALRELLGLRRAVELYRVGMDGKGRAEWDATVATLDQASQRQGALLAHDLGWHSRAIAGVANAGHFNDLTLRYPLPHRDNFVKYAARAKIGDSWAYGISRSESLFMRDIRSSAGAIGLMQLMPATGKATAKSLQVPYRGLSTLIDPPSNIRLGTAYLGMMQRRFDGSPVLATAAYNAGPHNVSRWLGNTDRAKADARVWIENIPYQETRKYVRRVLEADTIFHWRLTGEQKRVSLALSQVIGGGDAIARRND